MNTQLHVSYALMYGTVTEINITSIILCLLIKYMHTYMYMYMTVHVHCDQLDCHPTCKVSYMSLYICICMIIPRHTV